LSLSSQTYRPPGQRKRTDVECDHCVQRRAGKDAGRTTDLELAADLEGLRRDLRIRLEQRPGCSLTLFTLDGLGGVTGVLDGCWPSL
jgi:hypothetical protein